MHGGELRVLEVYGAPADLGRAHGEVCRGLIRRYTEDRLGKATEQRWSGAAEVDREFVLAQAGATLAHHQRFSPTLYDEMIAMAEAAGITAAEAVVVGGFTDLVDVVRSAAGDAPFEDDCTAVINPKAGFLAQTWDMHASAGEYVVVLKLDPLVGPAVVTQTTAGCLGQIGINEAGIAVGINNLTTHGRPGVTWPFAVRKALAQTTLDDAVAAIVDADLAGGHNFLVMGPEGVGVNIEAMPTRKQVTRVDSEPFVHSNHCLFSDNLSDEAPRPAESVQSSDLRLELGAKLADDLEAFFAEPAISRRASNASDTATCGAVIMEPAARRMRAVWGVPGDWPWETFQL